MLTSRAQIIADGRDRIAAERVDILVEAAGLGPDGLTIGCCRQPPMAGYNPAMVAEYRRVAGVDPRTLDYTDGEPFQRWLR